MRKRTKTNLPIEDHLDQVASGVASSRLSLLEAPPGSGKTTVLPLHLSAQRWLGGRKVLVLQPRRVAARTVAARMATLLGEQVGETVGYQVRMERQIGPSTQIEVITEGLLARRLISDPELSDVGLIIFDEFHERSLATDVSLVMALESAEALRPDLRLLVMSATLGDSSAVPALSSAWRYSFSAAPFPLEVFYAQPEPRRPVWESAGLAVVDAARRFEGDILAFLPGRYEIERTREFVASRLPSVDVVELYVEQSLSEQASALKPDPSGRRRVVVSSPIAETSLTIDGVRVVVDTGLHKVARTDTVGMSELTLEMVTLDAADQRAGRAARTGPGVCLRLWSEHEHRTLRPKREPEVLRSDLTSTLLDLAAWGCPDPASFGWLTSPTQAQLEAATGTLRALGAVDLKGKLTAHGRALQGLGTHPALAEMCLKAREAGLEDSCAAIIASLEARLPRRDSADLRPLLNAKGGNPSTKAAWLGRIRALPRSPSHIQVPEDDAVGYLLAAAFPGRIARRREAGSERYLLASGEGATLRRGDALRISEFLVAAQLQRGGPDLVISAAAPFNPALLSGPLKHLVTSRVVSSFEPSRGGLVARRQDACGSIVLKESLNAQPSADEQRAALLQFLSTPEGFHTIPFNDTATAFRHRVSFARSASPGLGLPDLSEAALMQSVDAWLLPFLPEVTSLRSINEERVTQALLATLTHQQHVALDREAPSLFRLRNGRTRPIHYDRAEGPYVEVVLQDLFGTHATPHLGTSKVPLTIALLSPAKRPVQVTRDLAGFWKGAYQQVRKELRGRYPKHRWPENPEEPE